MDLFQAVWVNDICRALEKASPKWRLGNGVKNLKGSETILERPFKGATQNGREPIR